MGRAIDLFVTYRFLKLLTTPFEKTEAYKLGIIDDNGNRIMQKVLLKKGLSQEVSKKLSKIIRDQLKKVNVSIQGESIRVIGKSKDDLQEAIALVKSLEEELEVPLQYENYR